MPVTIYHNPNCSISRRCLEMLHAWRDMRERETGEPPEVRIVEYLKHPLIIVELASLIAQMGVPVREAIRAKEPVYAGLGLADANDEDLLAAVAAHPILLNRPIVVTDKGAKLCRPPELVHYLL